MKRFLFLGLVALLGLGLTACQQNRNVTGNAAPASQEVTGQTFGEAITAAGAISYDELRTQMVGKDSMNVKVRGAVTEVCQAKGCWMNVVSANGATETMMVRFKDYGFFMPKDIAGREVVMEGVASMSEISVDELRHYAEDAGKSQAEIDAITQPKRELTFLASGVLLVDNN